MDILVACEESQAVTKEFRKLGHNAFSCDVLDCSGGHPEWHIKDDVLPLINGNCRFNTVTGQKYQIDKWDMIIAFPSCTYLSNVAAVHLFRGSKLNLDRYNKGLAAKKFFMSFWEADCKKVAIENPVSSKIFNLPNYSQEIQPFMFGHPYTKKTRLWLKGLPPLFATDLVRILRPWVSSGNNNGLHHDCLNRSKTFPGVAAAMADQWSNL